MATQLIHESRVQPLNDLEATDGDYVLYWMQQSQRTMHNDALEYAIRRANELNLPVLVAFGLMDDYPEANARHYRFMLDGLADVAASLARRGIRFTVQRGHPADVALEFAKDAAMVVCDRGYTRHQKAWRDRVADEARRCVVQVECDVVVPVDIASDKQEFAARTIRPKVTKRWGEYLVELRPTPVDRDSLGFKPVGFDVSEPDKALGRLKVDRSVPPNPLFKGGEVEARRLVGEFIHHHLTKYDAHRNQPHTDDVSHMSKYLHFGQVSPVWLAMQVRDAKQGGRVDRDSFIEELLVRRELAQNFVNFCPDYDRFSCLPAWARKTLAKHARDKREHLYSEGELEAGNTHDPYWNAAMKEMRETGYMHNYMRMYWGKKILEWTESPEEAHRIALHLNNKHFIDGRDPNSFANVNWVFGLHDRPWGERPVFGQVRYMNAAGLKRKTRPDEYVKKVDRLAAEVEAARS
jgi:deoxyribodipyrimidine photo-lyase